MGVYSFVKASKTPIGKKVVETVKNIFTKKSKVSPTIKSVKPTTNITGSVKKTKIDASLKNFRNVQKFRDQKEQGKIMMKEAQKELKRAVETKRATQIDKSIYHRNVPAEPVDLKYEKSAKAFKGKKGKELDKKAKGGRVGLKFGGGADMGKKKSNVQKIKETFGPKKQLSAKQMKIAKLAGNRKKIDAQDFKKLRGRG